MTKLTDLCDIQYGYAFDSGAFTDDESYPQLVRIRDVKRGYSETYYNGEYPEEYVLSAGDLLIGMDGEFNIARWKVDGALLNQRVCKIIAKDNADEEFLRFALSKALKAIEDRTSFATVKHLSAKELNKLEIPVPPYEEQKKISEILHRLEKVIDIRQNELASLDELIKARFVEMFESEEGEFDSYKLEEVADIISGITKGRKTKATEFREVPYMAVSNVKDGFIDWTTVKTILATEDEINQYRLQPDDVLMTEGGDPDKLGRGSVIHEPPIDCIHQNHIFRVRLDKTRVLPQYFSTFLQSPIAKAYFLKAAKQTTGIASINMKQLRNLPTVIPPISRQEEYVELVEQVDKSKVVVQKALDEAQLLFDSLMQEYFG